MKNLDLRVVVPIAVMCSLLGACASKGGPATTAPKSEVGAKSEAAPKPAVKKEAPAPAPAAQLEIDIPREPYYDQTPPSQPRQPNQPEAATPEAATPEPTPKPAPELSPEPPAALVAPPLTKQAEAVAILERAREKLAGVRTLDCVSLTESTGDAANSIPGLGKRNRVQLRFQYDDAVSVPFFIVTPIFDTATGEVLGPRAIYDGKRAVILDDAARTFVDPGRNWFDVVGPNLSAIPQWFLKERMTLARRKPGANLTGAGAIEPELLGARILGVEQLDGQECDVVELYYSKPIVKFSETTGKPEVVDEQRHTETVHFARADAMPRKIVIRDIPHPSAPAGSGSTITSHYLRMVVNPGYEPNFFDTSIPAGYLPQPKR